MKTLLVALCVPGGLLLLLLLVRMRALARVFAQRHFQEVAAALPALRRAAVAGIDQTEPQADDARALLTSAGLVVLYTIRRDAPPIRFIHHVSVSLGGGRTPHGVGSFFLIFVLKGLGIDPKTVSLGVSKTRIFHSEWTLSDSQQSAFAAGEAPPIPSAQGLWNESVALRSELQFGSTNEDGPA